jgi:hypothetical protein
MKRLSPVFIVAVAAIILGITIVLVNMLIHKTIEKEGFAMASDKRPEDVENPISPQEFSYALLQSVMGPIRRLSSQLTNMGTWRDRIRQSRMTPDELAREYLASQHSQHPE